MLPQLGYRKKIYICRPYIHLDLGNLNKPKPLSGKNLAEDDETIVIPKDKKH